MDDLGHLYRQLGVAQARRSPEQLQQDEAVALVIGPAGGIDPRTLAPHLPLIGADWGPGDTGWRRARQPATVVLLAARCTSAPNSGDAVVTLVQETETGGLETIATLTIPQGSRFAAVSPQVAVPADAWLSATLTTAAGATGVSASVSMRVR